MHRANYQIEITATFSSLQQIYGVYSFIYSGKIVKSFLNNSISTVNFAIFAFQQIIISFRLPLLLF